VLGVFGGVGVVAPIVRLFVTKVLLKPEQA